MAASVLIRKEKIEGVLYIFNKKITERHIAIRDDFRTKIKAEEIDKLKKICYNISIGCIKGGIYHGYCDYVCC